jgi:rare lipoprotein A
MVTSFYSAPRAEIAAHKSLPFGTILRLFNPKSGSSANVLIDDRGTFIKGRQLDISSQRAAQLGFVPEGFGPLEVEILHVGDGKKISWGNRKKIIQHVRTRHKSWRVSFLFILFIRSN